ncbi:hypothetical protein M5689_021471 [Euphorbia peplus]|nr:hypothetical protein M5689_021471 [Euphorbia peplus]
MSCMLNLSSQAVVLGAAMAVSSTVLFLAFSKQKNPSSPNLRSCLSSSSSSSEEKRKENKKKKRVKFAENVKDTKGNGEEYRRQKERKYSMSKIDRIICRSDIKMPANRAALYNGILRDRVHRVQCSY